MTGLTVLPPHVKLEAPVSVAGGPPALSRQRGHDGEGIDARLNVDKRAAEQLMGYCSKEKPA